jgi:hypothetical protein
VLTSVRPSSFGEWFATDVASGTLRFDAEPGNEAVVRDRIVASTLAVRAANVDGVARIADLVVDNDRLWLITESPIRPCLADLLGPDDSHDAAAAVTLLTKIGHTLSALHAAGLAHGSLAADCVIVEASGRVVLAETALAAAVFGRTVTSADDAKAWAAIARIVAPTWARSDASTWRMILAAAAVAESAGLRDALSRLGVIPAPADVPAATQAATQAVRSASAPVVAADTPVAADTAAAIPVAVATQGRAIPAVSGQAVTQLGRSSASGRAPSVRTDAAPAVDELRFGPGVPALAEHVSAHAVARGVTASPTHATRRPAMRRRRFRSALLTVAVIALVLGWLWWRQGVALHVQQVAVHATLPPGSHCDATVDVAADISVTGTGRVSYQWVRGDGQTSAVLTHTVWPGQHDAIVHLYWEFSGTGHYDATAALHVVHPATASGNTTFTYACP